CAAEHDKAKEHGQPANGCDQKGLASACLRVFVGIFEANEKVAGDACPFPKDIDCQQVIGPYKAEHTRHEEKDLPVEEAQALFPFKVIAGVEGNACADPGDDEAEEHAQPVEPEREFKPQS